MNEELEKLQSIGAQKIYETTHIPVKYVQSMLHGSFEGFSKVQFIGFISILEREYQQDLSELKKFGLIYFDEQKEESVNDGLFIVPKKQKSKKNLYLLLLAIIFGIVLLLQFFVFNDTTLEAPVDKIFVETTTKNIEPLVVKDETNSTLEDNTSSVEEIVEVVKPKAIEKSFKIVSKSKVWYGYIDVKTNKHYQGTMKGEKDLDPSKAWLLLFGHGYINMYVNGEIQKFSSRDKVRFLYKNNILTAVSIREFKKLNKGRKW